MNKNEFEVLYLIKKEGLSTIRNMAKKLNVSVGTIANARKALEENGLVNNDGITDKGLDALKPYKVDNAIIMAAGMSSRFVPLSLEKPKGLLEVKGEILIERQIRQLHEAGIKNIVIVLGYKKESFFYLENKFEGVKIIINPKYNIKNNTYTLFLVKDYLKNSYICSSDDYFTENVFEEYVYSSYYASIHVTEKLNEWYMEKGHNNEIKAVRKYGDEGDIMLGHVYWNKEFSLAMSKYLIETQTTGEYDNSLWEQILLEHVKDLPPMTIKTYDNVIFEFDSLEELRQFDKTYIKKTRSKIMENIANVMNCGEDEISDFKPIKEGMTNDSFIFSINGNKYVYRNPGEGTNKIINRKHEKRSLEIAKKYGIDPTFIYMDDESGFKISHYVENIREPNYDNFNDSKRILKVLKKLHEANIQVEWTYLPYEESLEIERKVKDKGPIESPDFDQIKERIKKVYENVKDDNVPLRFCHCDSYKPNWMLTDKETILIDWEYSGNADPGCDLAVYIMDARYSIEEATKFINEYLGTSSNEKLIYHYLAYVALCSWYWYVWALYRESCGAVMGESLYNWYLMARDYSAYLI